MKSKSNIFKYVFILVIIVLICYCIYYVYSKNKEKENDNSNTTQTQETTILTDMRLAIANFDTMNPILTNNKNVQDISKLIFEPLLDVDQEYKINPCLAQEWSKINDTTYLLKLRNDVKWQDGQNFTAKDVQFTIDKLKDTSIYSVYSVNVGNIIQVEVIDDYTVRITLNEAVPFFEYNLTFPILSKSYYEGQDFVSTEKNSMPIGTGRYKITYHDGNKITLQKNTGWWKVKEENSIIQTINIGLYTSVGEVYNAFKLGNIDMIHTSITNIEDYLGTMGYMTKDYTGRQYDFLVMNCEKSILSDSFVRNAIAYGIDRDNIVASIYNNKYVISDFPLDYGSYLYQVDKVNSGYNQNKTTELLTEAGWSYKNKYWQKTENYRTSKLSLNLVVNASNSNRVAVAELIEEQLENVGISINIIKASDAQYQSYLENKNYDMILTGVYSSISPDLTTYLGTNNMANFHHEEVDAIMQEVVNITDENLLKEKYNRLIEIYYEQRPYISLYYNKNTVIYHSSFAGDISPTSYNIFYNIEKWYRQN